MTDFLAGIQAAREKALRGNAPTRRTDAVLYDLLGDCLALCEAADTEEALEDLRQAVRVSVSGRSESGRGRKYVETTTKVYILVARAVLEGNDNRNSFYRYAYTLEEAARRGIRSGDLPDWLATQGGVNALYKARPTRSRSGSTKTLHLNQPITTIEGQRFVVELCRDDRGFFNVTSAPQPTTARIAAE